MTTTKFFAAYDADTIYGVGTTEPDALECAYEMAYGDENIDLSIAEISETLFNQIERQGWDGRRQSFEIRDGMLVDTTNE